MTKNQKLIILLSFSILISYNVFSQNELVSNKIYEFKHKVIKQSEYLIDTLDTQNYFLRRTLTPYYRLVTTKSKISGITTHEYFSKNGKILFEKFDVDSNMSNIGTRVFYDKKGEIESSLNYDSLTWRIYKKTSYPSYNVLCKAKLKADSIIIDTYGHAFFDKFIVWQPDYSYVLGDSNLNANWVEKFNWQPKEFCIKYAIKISKDEFYNEQVEIHLNDKLDIVLKKGEFNVNKGLEHTDKFATITINKDRAMKIALFSEAYESPYTMEFTYMDWTFDDFYNPKLDNGHLNYNLAIRRINNTDDDSKPFVAKYDIYVFNPWTGLMTKKIKMKSSVKSSDKYMILSSLKPDK